MPKTELDDVAHPCWQNPGGTHTTFELRNDASTSPHPLPRPDQLEQRGDLYYAAWGVSEESDTRVTARAVVSWDGQEHIVELDLHTGQGFDDLHPALDVALAGPRKIRRKTGQLVRLDGRFTTPRYELPQRTPSELHIRWHALVADLVERGLLPAPIGVAGDPFAGSETLQVALLTRVRKENDSPTGAAVADLTVRDFRLESRRPDRGPVISTALSCEREAPMLTVAGSGFGPDARLQLYDETHAPIGAQLAPVQREGSTTLEFELEGNRLAESGFVRILSAAGASNFVRSPL